MKSFKHQTAIVSGSWDREGHALFCDTGTGKTRMALLTAEQLYRSGKIDAVLVIAPAGVYRNWSDVEIPKHLSHANCVWVYSSALSTKARRNLLEMSSNTAVGLTFLIMNVEAFSHPKSDAVKIAEAFLKSHHVLMVIDESTQIKVPSARKTKTLLRLGGLASYRRVLSGMPITEGPENLYTQCLFLRTGRFPYKSFYSFRNRFCSVETKYFGGRRVDVINKEAGCQNAEELYNLLREFSSIVHKSECLDLPDKMYERRMVELTPEQEVALKSLKDEARILYDNNELTVVNALTMLEKQHQVVCGFFKTEDGTAIDLPTKRYQALLDQLEEVDGKVVIWAPYVHNIITISGALKMHYATDTVATFFGQTASEDRPEIMNRFQNGDLRFLVANPATGKYGWTLTAAHTAIYFTNSYRLEDRHQSEDRLHRIGQTNKVTYIDLVAPGTVDEAILNALRDKKNVAHEIMGWRDMLVGE